MGGYENLPDPVPAAQMVYNKVGRALLGGYNGQAGSIPTTITDGGIYSHTFNYTLPSGANVNNFRAVVLVIDGSTNEIINGNSFALSTLSNDKFNNTNIVSLFPNPANDFIQLSNIDQANIVITDMTGKVVLNQNNVSKDASINISNLTSGVYFVSVNAENTQETIKFIKK
jgi:hypothetical protein